VSTISGCTPALPKALRDRSSRLGSSPPAHAQTNRGPACADKLFRSGHSSFSDGAHPSPAAAFLRQQAGRPNQAVDEPQSLVHHLKVNTALQQQALGRRFSITAAGGASPRPLCLVHDLSCSAMRASLCILGPITACPGCHSEP
jgi:hypothetical protein